MTLGGGESAFVSSQDSEVVVDKKIAKIGKTHPIFHYWNDVQISEKVISMSLFLFHERLNKISEQRRNMVTTTNDTTFVFLNVMVMITRPNT